MAKLALVVVLPTPPLPEVTTMILAMGGYPLGVSLSGSITSLPSTPPTRRTWVGLDSTSAGSGTSLVR